MHPHLLHLVNVKCSLHLESNWQEMLANRKRWFGNCSREAVFKIDDSKREILCRLKDLTQQNYDSTELEDSLQAVNDTSTSLVESDEEVDDDSQEIVIIVIDDDSKDED